MIRRDFVAMTGTALLGASLPRLPRDAAAADDRFVERWSWAMGQPVHLIVYANSEQHGLDACAAALAELRRVEAHLTRFDDASDLCELNRRAGRKAMWVDEDLRVALRQGERYRRLSGGAFNVAIEPLMRAWGFHEPRASAPSPAELEEAREAVAATTIEIDGHTVRLPSRHTQVDLGSIGVGYGIDRALGVLRALGVRRAFCDISGDCAALGAPPGEEGWLVGIADPTGRRKTIASARIRDGALATAANTESLVHYGALVAGHVMDPGTGWPATRVLQASVVTGMATAADALSTATFVLGRAARGVWWSWIA